MRIFGLALVGVLATTTPMTGRAAGPAFDIRPTDQGPASNIAQVWDGSGSGGHSEAIGGHSQVGRARQWNGGAGAPHWGQNRRYGARGFQRRAGADLLGLGSGECSLRLPLRGLPRPDGRVGQSIDSSSPRAPGWIQLSVN
jgi:hypothetical protein